MKRVIGKCRMCEQIKRLIDAHSIPRTFFKGLKEGFWEQWNEESG